MYNSTIPKHADLPSSARLLRSTILAGLSAVALLVTVILPADYGIDPTGAGRALGLVEMGEIKVKLAAEAEADRLATVESSSNTGSPSVGDGGDLAIRIAALEDAVNRLARQIEANGLAAGQHPQTAPEAASTMVPMNEQPSAEAATPEQVAMEQQESVSEEASVAALAPSAPEPKSDKVSFKLTPGEGIEIKLVMKEGARTNFIWASEGGPVNFDAHGDGPGGNSISYEKGRAVQSDNGTLVAAFDGNHGWFWRNRGKQDVTVTLQTNGYYSEIKGVP